jgi:hypothetical protein
MGTICHCTLVSEAGCMSCLLAHRVCIPNCAHWPAIETIPLSARAGVCPAAGEGGSLGLISQGGGSGGSSKHPHGLTRKNMRTGSEAIKALVEIVGTSGKIYQHLIDLCKVRWVCVACYFRGFGNKVSQISRFLVGSAHPRCAESGMHECLTSMGGCLCDHPGTLVQPVISSGLGKSGETARRPSGELAQHSAGLQPIHARWSAEPMGCALAFCLCRCVCRRRKLPSWV